MKKILYILFILVPLLCFSQNFTQEINSIPVQQSGWILQQPWAGGFNDSDPALVDIDGDGDLDLYLGTRYGYCDIAYFENIGNANVLNFLLITKDIFLDTLTSTYPSYQHSSPTFGDLDGDGDFDMLIGGLTGIIAFAENGGTTNNPYFYLQDTLFNNIDVGAESKPALIDIDADGDLDLFIGARDLNFINNDGRIVFYRNDGDIYNYNFVFITNYFDSIDVGSNSAPCFIDIDSDDDYDLFIGENDGNINFYRNEGTPEVWDFVLVDSMFAGIDLGEYSSVPEFGDIDGDGDYDLLIGQGEIHPDYNDQGGWVYLYENVGDSVNFNYELVCPNLLCFDIGFKCLPAFAELYQDGVYDIIVGRGEGEVFLYRNIGTSDSSFFIDNTTVFNNITVTYEAAPCFADIDNDGDQDLFLGREIMMSSTSVLFFRNVGSMGNPEFVFEDEIFPGYTGFAYPALTDIDDDSDYDLFIGREGGNLTYYENQGTPEEYSFIHITDDYLPNSLGYPPLKPTFCDINSDGDADLFMGNFLGFIYYFENIGSPDTARFRQVTSQYIELEEYGEVWDTAPAFSDVDNDGDFDFFCGNDNGGMQFFRNIGSSVFPDFRREFGVNDYKLYQNYPNPFNLSTVISFELRAASPVELAVYDMLGREVASLVNGHSSFGKHEVVWDASNQASGVYFVRLSVVSGQSSMKKIMLVK